MEKYEKFKVSAPALGDKFGQPDGPYSVSDIQDNFDYTIKKHVTLTDNPPTNIYINKTENKITFNI